MHAHSLTEYFEMVDTHLGPQLVFLASAALVGALGEKPVCRFGINEIALL